MRNSPRSQEDFDSWFLESNGDPWGYKGRYIQDRLKDSLSFLQRKINRSFEGTFIEFGAFDGSFTTLLARTYLHARIISNDISLVAIDRLKEAVRNFSHVEIIPGDMISFFNRDLSLKTNNGLVILLMECLYYLPYEEQVLFLKNVRSKYPMAQVLLSAPVQGGAYYDEAKLKDLLSQTGFGIVSRAVLTYTKVPPIPRLFNHLINNSSYFRHLYANQVIHLMKPEPLH